MDILPQNLTDRARKVFALADEEAERLHHGYLGTDHVFLGLLREGNGVAANVLKNLDIDLRKIGMEIENLIAAGPDAITTSRRPQTPAVKRLIEYAMEEAHGLKHTWIGTEHVLLGLARAEMDCGASAKQPRGHGRGHSSRDTRLAWSRNARSAKNMNKSKSSLRNSAKRLCF